ncbi:hypothetical protein BGZ93_000558 [Podila epicladia]|nr:hypothetical protein BGZ93_000558 [Podila epicladia]
MAAGTSPKRIRTFMTEPSFPEHCALIHYMYTGEILTEVNVRRFVVTAMPVESPDMLQDKSYVIGDLALSPMWNIL